MPTKEEEAEDREETGWKLVHQDVFRAPSRMPMTFCVCVGSGVQVFACTLATIVFAAIGFVSPANRGSLMVSRIGPGVLARARARRDPKIYGDRDPKKRPSGYLSSQVVMLLLYVLCGSFAGYHTARLYKAFKGKHWQRVTMLCAFFYPGVYHKSRVFLSRLSQLDFSRP